MKGLVTALALTMALLLTGCGSRNPANNYPTGQANPPASTQNGNQTAGDRTDNAVNNNGTAAGTAGDRDVVNPDGHYEAEPDGAVTERPGEEYRDGSISEGAHDVVDGTADAAEDVTNGVANGARNVTDGVINGARDVVDGVVDGARNVTDDVINGVDNAANGARNGVRDVTPESRTAR